MPNALTRPIDTFIKRLQLQREWGLIVLGAVTGTVTGLAAVGFAWALHAVEHWAGEFAKSTPLWVLPLVPMIGALLTGIVIYFFASDARGHGVPQVISAVATKAGVIRPRVGIVKAIASILTVGSGGSSGAEGPIVQVGSTIGSAIGQLLHVNRERMQTLVGCGAAAGIASIFNAPIAGVFFVLEVILRDFSVRMFTPIVVASVFSSAITQLVLGGRNEAIFPTTEALHDYAFLPAEIPSFVLLGLTCAAAAIGFSRMLHKGEDLFARSRIHPIVRPVAGAFMLGVLGIGFVLLQQSQGGPVAGSEIPPFFGNGYGPIQELLAPSSYIKGSETEHILTSSILLLVALAIGKSLATTFTLGSGGSGGTFAPSLFIGAATGAAFGMVLDRLGLIPEGGTPALHALVGMAAVFAAAAHAPMTAILIVLELTRDVYVLLPLMLTSVIATVLAQLIDRDSIYTFRLRQAGLAVGSARDLTLMRRIAISTVRLTPLPAGKVYPSDPLKKLIDLQAEHHIPDFAVVDTEGRYVGMVTGADIRAALIDREAIPLLLVAELVRSDLPTISPEETLDAALEKFAAHDVASLALIADPRAGRPAGLITRASVMARYQEALRED